MPMQRTAYSLLQRYVTRSYPRALSPTRESSASQQHHLRTFRAHFGPLEEARLFEFGAGWGPLREPGLLDPGHQPPDGDGPVALGPSGLRRRSHSPPPAGASRGGGPHARSAPPGRPGLRPEPRADLRNPLPGPRGRARHPAAGGSIDLVATISTLEHVPLPELRTILRETRRLCHDRSVVSHVVDYSDHFAHGTTSIKRLQLPPLPLGAVAALQHLLPPPEPLRHRDYRPIFEEAGFA